MRIALVHPFPWPEVRRGGERYLDDLARYLRASGHYVDVITGDQEKTCRLDLGPSGQTIRLKRHVRPGHERRWLGLAESFGLRAYPSLVGKRYDIVHALMPSAALAARAAFQRTVYTVLGHPSPFSLPTRRAGRSILRAAVKTAHVVTALSGSAANAVRMTFGRTPRVLAPGVDLERFDRGHTERSKTPTILFPASLSTSNKGLVYLLHAVDVLLQRDANIRLQLAGPGDHTWALREAGASEQVVAALDVVGVGTLEDLPTRYAAAHVTALPSRDEAFGLVLLESLACGTPIVGGAVGGAQDIITDDRIGSLVPFGDHHALATALLAALKLAAEPTTTRNCRNHALHWNWSDHTGPAHETLYSELLHKRAR